MKTSSERSKERRTIARKARSKRDHTKYRFNGELYGKSRLALAVVQAFMKKHPRAKLDDVRDQLGSVVADVRTAKSRSKKYQRYFLQPDSIIKTADGKKAAVTNQWSLENIKTFLKHIADLGFKVRPVNMA